MDNLLLERTFNTPEVKFLNSGELELLGRSIPEHPLKFYQPINDWIDNYLATSPSKLKLAIYLDYLNTHSTECVLIIMKKINDYFESNSGDSLIEWQYDEDDEDMESLGEDLKSFIKVPFELKPVAE